MQAVLTLIANFIYQYGVFMVRMKHPFPVSFVSRIK